eukprot:6843830-Prymnesium_polylepis.1
MLGSKAVPEPNRGVDAQSQPNLGDEPNQTPPRRLMSQVGKRVAQHAIGSNAVPQPNNPNQIWGCAVPTKPG